MTASAIIALAAALTISVCATFTAISQGKTATKAMESIARQPESAGDIRSSLIIVLCKYNTSNVESISSERIYKSQNILVVCDSKVSSDFVLFNITCIDNNNYLSLLFKLRQHIDLTVWSKSRKHS